MTARVSRIVDWIDERSGLKETARHLLAEPIRGGARWAYVFGSVLLFLLILQVVTGIFLTLYYAPSANSAHASVAFIQKAAPGAEEAISYQIPTFRLNGNLIYFAGFQNHVSVYPAPRGAKEFKEELAGYEGGKGTVRFSLNEPIPYDLITRITKYRVQQNDASAATRKTKTPARKSKKRVASAKKKR